MTVDNATVQKLALAVTHIRGHTVVNHIPMRALPKHREFHPLAVGQHSTAPMADLAGGDLTDDALLQQHQRDPSVGNGSAKTANVAKLRQSQLGGKQDITKTQSTQKRRRLTIGHIETEIAVQGQPRLACQGQMAEIAEEQMLRPPAPPRGAAVAPLPRVRCQR